MSLPQEKKEMLFHNLEQNGFGKLNRNDLSEETATTFTKIALPVLYVVTLVYNGHDPNFATRESTMVAYLENNVKQYHCTHLVHVNIYITEEKGQPLLFPYIPGETTIHVTWYMHPDSLQVSIPKGQPDKILNLKQILQHTPNPKQNEKNIAQSNAYSSRIPIATYILILVNLLLFAYSLTQNDQFLYSYASNRNQIIVQGEYYRLFTSMFLHDGGQHIAYNALTLYVFGTRTERFFGHIPFLFLYMLSGLAGCFCSLYFQPVNVYSLGASGAICGLVTAFFLMSVTQKHIAFDLDSMSIVLYIIITIGTGFIIPGVDYYGHLGGLIAGFAIGLFYLFMGKKKTFKHE